MRLRNWILAPLMAISVAALPARAADAAPTLVVRVKAIDGLIADGKYLAGLAGHSEQADQFEKMLPAFLGPKGLAGTGLDTARPWGLYATLDPQIPNSPVVMLIPVADENAFVASLNMFAGFVPGGNVTIAKGGDGVYTVSSPAAPVQAYFTIADRYAYITAIQKDSIAAGKRLPAAKLLPPDDRTVVGVSLHLDTIDPQFKQIALGQFENQVAAIKEQKNKAETAVQTKLKSDVIDYVAGQIRSLMTDGQAVEFQLLLDRKTDDISAQLSLTAKPGSPLAKQIAAEGRQISRFGPLNAAAVQGALKVAVPEALRAALSEAIDEGFKQEQERQKDAMKKTLAQRIFGVLSPTLKAGELDIFAGFVGPNAEGKYTLAGGIKVKDAPKVEQLVRDLVPIIPDPKAKEAIAFDAETIGDVKVHKVTPYDLDSEATRLFGTGATARVAFPTDAVVVAFGADSANVLKQVLGSAGKPGGPFRAEASIARVVGLNKGADQKQAKQAAAAAFAGKPHADLIQFTIDGGAALRVHASMKAQVVTFGMKMDEAAKGKTP